MKLGDAIPFGFFLLLPARLPVLSSWIDRRLARAARNSAQADAYFELERVPDAPEPLPPEPTPARRTLWGALSGLREAAVLVLIVSGGRQVLIENRAVPKWLKPEQRPEWMTAIVVYPRLFQGWSSLRLHRLATTVASSWRASRKMAGSWTRSPGGANFEVQPRGGYHMNQIGAISTAGSPSSASNLSEGVREMLRNFHQITGRPADELRSFEVYFVSEQIPPPGGVRAPAQKKRLFGWNAPMETPKTRGKRRTP